MCLSPTDHGPFLQRQVTAGHMVDSEVKFSFNHSGGSRDRKRGWVVH